MKTLAHLFVLAVLICSACKDKQSENFTYHKETPEEFPDPGIPGFHFPEDSATLNQWIQASLMDSIYLHGWGIWTGLTTKSGQYVPGDSASLLVYETWMTPEEMIDSINGVRVKRSNRANLKAPHQLAHVENENGLKGEETVNDSISESVSYSPAAAKFAIEEKLFLATTLYSYGGIQKRTEIPFFPNNAITLKPVFKLLRVTSGQTLFNISSWSGPTPDLKAFPEKDWGSFVTVDVTNGSQSGGTTYNLSDFVYFKLNDEDAYFFNKEFSENKNNQFNAKPGDIAILIAMHVGTREITNWTWQTFWWAPDADNPPAPSSKAIADKRPEQLTGAPRHYAMSVAYYMVNPKEPYRGANVKGSTNYAFNPYLESGFGPGVFNDSISYVMPASGSKIKTFAGVRTNCMSCHRMASVNPASISTANNSTTPYVGNSYVSVSDSLFKDQLLLDFAWSVQGNVDTTGWSKFIKDAGNQAMK